MRTVFIFFTALFSLTLFLGYWMAAGELIALAVIFFFCMAGAGLKLVREQYGTKPTVYTDSFKNKL